MTYHARVSDSGEIILPADIALAMGLHPGDRVEIERQGPDIILSSDRDVIKAGQRAFRATIKHSFTVADFLADRRAEAARD